MQLTTKRNMGSAHVPSICIKMLSSQLALKKHMNVHEEKHNCISIELATKHFVQITY
jgi:hypothetical protein